MLFFLQIIDDTDAREYFERIYHDYHKMMFSCALGMMKNHHDAEDALQQVLLNLWKYMENVKKVSPERLRSYLCITTKNHCNTLLKRSKSNRFVSLEDCIEYCENWEDNPESIMIDSFNRAALTEAFNGLSPQYRQIILDKAVLHLTDEQAAEHIGIKSTYARECLCRARASLRKRYLSQVKEPENIEKNKNALVPSWERGRFFIVFQALFQ